jgi:hypothetical protein
MRVAYAQKRLFPMAPPLLAAERGNASHEQCSKQVAQL